MTLKRRAVCFMRSKKQVMDSSEKNKSRTEDVHCLPWIKLAEKVHKSMKAETSRKKTFYLPNVQLTT